MIDNEDQITANFTNDLKLKSLPEMDRNLATQLMEATLILTTIDNKNGVGTALRAVCQQEAFNIRLDNCIKLSNMLWTASTRRGAYSIKAKVWLDTLNKEVADALVEVYGTQLEEIGVTRDHLYLKGNLS